MLASHDEDPIEDEALLTGTGSGGMFTSGYLREGPLIGYLEESERVSYLLSNKKKGVRRESDDDSTAFTPGDGYQAITAITDTRVLFVVGDSESDGDEMFTIPYTEIEDVKTGRGVLTKRIDVWTTEGVRWRFPVKSSVDIGPAADYLELAAVVWARVEGQLYHVENHIEDVETAVDEGGYDRASEVAADAREYVFEAQDKARELTTNRSDAIWGRIDELEEKLDRTVLDIHVARAEHCIERAERHEREEKYNKALDAYESAREEFEDAVSVGRNHDLPETPGLLERIDDVTQAIDHVQKAPLKQAEHARNRAEQAEDPEMEARLWEEALEKHQTVMVLGWGEDSQRFAGNTGEIRHHLERIVDNIEDARFQTANRHRVSGYWYYKEGQYDCAREQFAVALDHVEQALSVTDELKPTPAAELLHAREDLEAKIEETQRKAGEAVFEFVNDQPAGTAAEFARVEATSTERNEPAKPSEADIQGRIRELSPRRFRQLVAETWGRMGYETTLKDGEGVDIVAEQNRPVPEKQLIVTEQEADEVNFRTIQRSALVRDVDREADVAAFVTTGAVTDGARDAAEEHNVKLIDGKRLCDILVAEGVSPDTRAFDDS